MSINAQYQTDSYTKKTAELSAQTMIEIKFTALDAGDAVAVYPQIALTSCEVSSGRVNYGGRLIVTLAYVGEDGKLCRIQKGAEFTHYIDDDSLAPSQTGQCTLTCAGHQLKRDGSSYVVAVIADARVDVYDNSQRSFINAVDGAVCRTESAKLYSMTCFSGESEVDDEFDCAASDVLVPSAKALVLDCNARAGVIEISGEIYLSLLAVRDSSPVGLDRIIPFKCEISCDDAMFSQRAYCNAQIKSLNVNCKVVEDRGKCSVGFNATLSFNGHFFDEEEVSFVSDAFSKEKNLTLAFSEESTQLDTDTKVYTERINGLCASKAKLDYTCSFMAAALPSVEFSRTADGIDGSVTATLIYEQGGEFRSSEVNLPFSLKLSGLQQTCKSVNVAVCGVSLRQRAEGECEGEAVVKITAADGESRSVRYLTEVTEGEDKPVSDCAVSVFIPEAGDGLWETAKRLSETPENIERSNPELKFPLTGTERILIFRAKN